MRASTCRWLYLNIVGPELDELMRDREPRIQDASLRSWLIPICGLEDLINPKFRRLRHPPQSPKHPIGRHLPGAASAPSLEAHHQAKVVITTAITPLTQLHINVNSFFPSLFLQTPLSPLHRFVLFYFRLIRSKSNPKSLSHSSPISSRVDGQDESASCKRDSPLG